MVTVVFAHRCEGSIVLRDQAITHEDDDMTIATHPRRLPCTHGAGQICPNCEDAFAERQGRINPDGVYLRREVLYAPTRSRTPILDLVIAAADAEMKIS